MGATRSKERITKACDNCGEPVTRPKSADAPRFYCDHQCYSRSKRRSELTSATNSARYPNGRESRPCLRCGTSVTKAPSRFSERTFCGNECRHAHRRDLGAKFVNSNGYVVVGVPLGTPGSRPNGTYAQILEHRLVMQRQMGRPLLPDESVHHINGVRTDNRPENLELWSKSQPAGQRVADKVAWARAVLETYADMFPPNSEGQHPWSMGYQLG